MSEPVEPKITVRGRVLSPSDQAAVDSVNETRRRCLERHNQWAEIGERIAYHRARGATWAAAAAMEGISIKAARSRETSYRYALDGWMPVPFYQQGAAGQ